MHISTHAINQWNRCCIYRGINAVDVIKRAFNLCWWNNRSACAVRRGFDYTRATACDSCPRTGKSILGFSVAATSGSHLLVKDLASFKLLSPRATVQPGSVATAPWQIKPPLMAPNDFSRRHRLRWETQCVHYMNMPHDLYTYILLYTLLFAGAVKFYFLFFFFYCSTGLGLSSS